MAGRAEVVAMATFVAKIVASYRRSSIKSPKYGGTARRTRIAPHLGVKVQRVAEEKEKSVG